MSVDNTSFGLDTATRQVQPGDTPDLNDGLLSRNVTAGGSPVTIIRGEATFLIDGVVTQATAAFALNGYTPFVPIEGVTAAANTSEPISGVGAPQRVALQVKENSTALNPGDYVKPIAGEVEKFLTGATADDARLKYARYLGKEAALLDTATSTPFNEKLTVGIVPDQTLTPSSTVDDPANVGWFQLM